MRIKPWQGVSLGLFMTLLATGCAQRALIEPRQDPLIGQIIDAHTQKPLLYEALLERLLLADVIYLGERHDNAEHHRIQLQVLQSLIDQGLQPVLGFEFFDTAQTGYLMQYISSEASLMPLGISRAGLESPEKSLRTRLGWTERADTDWGYYFALLEFAKTHRLTVFGADLPAGIKLRLSRTDLDALTPVEQQALGMQALASNDYKRFMYTRFKAGHCGWGMEPLLTRLYRTWHERNDRMARSIVAMSQAERQGPVVVILGAGHTEHNEGVVTQVERLQPQLQQLNIGLQEIAIEAAPLDSYLFGDHERRELFGPRYDLFWFTQRQNYQDHCAAFKKSDAAQSE